MSFRDRSLVTTTITALYFHSQCSKVQATFQNFTMENSYTAFLSTTDDTNCDAAILDSTIAAMLLPRSFEL